MNLYLDDNLAGKMLDLLLTKAGHNVVQSHGANLSSATDPKHLTYAIGASLILLTNDWEDFEDLHVLVLAAGGSHPGIITVRYDNDSGRDMKPAQIVKAIGKLERSGMTTTNELVILNHWR
jgi:predicted nuclease of predicted toxin-antitoxin system